MNDFYDIPIRQDVYAPIGKILYINSAPKVIIAHPLDVIAMRYPKDPLKRLDAAMEWILNRAHRKLDTMSKELGGVCWCGTYVDDHNPYSDNHSPVRIEPEDLTEWSKE